VELLYRVLGGGRQRPLSPEAEREEVDLYTAAVVFWQAVETLLSLPDAIAVQVWNKSPWVQLKSI
jgi:hypothetical protein